MFDLVFDEESGTEDSDVGTSSQSSMGPAIIHSVQGVENNVPAKKIGEPSVDFNIRDSVV